MSSIDDIGFQRIYEVNTIVETNTKTNVKTKVCSMVLEGTNPSQLNKSFENIGYIHFVHASNYFFINDKKNYRFLHNLDKFSMNLDFNDFTTSSSFVGGGLTTMIGLAML